jgi:predicted nucleic acid-binding protein
VNLYYLDTSAALKLLAEESHSLELAQFYDEHTDADWVSSTLLRIELVRAVTRTLPALLHGARELLMAFDYLSIDDEIIEAAAGEPDRSLRSLDAIHLATARALGSDLTAIVTYDDLLAQAGQDAGISIVSPRG